MSGLAGFALFVFLVWLSEVDKPACFVVCILLGVAMIAGVL